jgi:hypothetical protein
VINAVINAIAWAGIVMLFDFTTWKGNILSWYGDWLETRKSKLFKPFGLCRICMCFWFGLWFLMIDYRHYFIFLGISEMILIFYQIIVSQLNK